MWPFKPKNNPLPLPVTDDNVLMILAYPKRRVIAVSYKGETKTGKFQENTLRNMLHGKKFEKNVETFLGAVARLLEQLTQP